MIEQQIHTKKNKTSIHMKMGINMSGEVIDSNLKLEIISVQ